MGCGQSRHAGWVNCDLYPNPGVVDVVCDLQQPWPFPDNSAEIVYASHVLEHLTDFRAFFREAWRVLAPGRTLYLRLPYGGHRAAWWDVTHIRPWFAESFAFVQPNYDAAIGNPQHTAWVWPFAVDMVRMRLASRFAQYLRWRVVRWPLMRIVRYLTDAVEELFITLTALKTPVMVDDFVHHRLPHIVPAEYVAYRHHLRGQLKPPRAPELVSLHSGLCINGFI